MSVASMAGHSFWVTFMIAIQGHDLHALADRVTRALSSARVNSDGVFVNTPLLYPSGSSVVIRIHNLDGRFFVSDMAQAQQEAEMMGAERTFQHHAPTIARQAGIGFDRQSFFVTEVSEPQITGAVTAVANCSCEAATVVAYKLAENKNDDYLDRLYDKLDHVFGRDRVQKDVELAGASSTKWHLAAEVHGSSNRSYLFDFVSPHPNSIAAAVTKFGDIAELDDAPDRVAVVQDQKKLGTRLTVLARTASVIELDAPDATYQKIAIAA